jgi:hypothetical protein
MTWRGDEIGPAVPVPVSAPSLNPSDLDWWWQFGFDGLIGGVIGGAATGVAVWLTLRHERRLSDEMSLRTLVGEMQGTLLRLALQAPKDGDADDVHRWKVETFAAMSRVHAGAQRYAPELAQDFGIALPWFILQVTPNEKWDWHKASRMTKVLHAQLVHWQVDDEKYKLRPRLTEEDLTKVPDLTTTLLG